MTSALSVRGRRAGAALGAATLAALVLAGCSKPTPVAQVTVGDRTATTEAQCYDHGEAISSGELAACVKERAGASISVGQGDKVRIGVEPKIADKGWVLFLDGRPTSIPGPNKRTYITFNGDSFFAGQQGPQGQPVMNDKAKLGIVGVDGDGKYQGAWSFDLKRQD